MYLCHTDMSHHVSKGIDAHVHLPVPRVHIVHVYVHDWVMLKVISCIFCQVSVACRGNLSLVTVD